LQGGPVVLRWEAAVGDPHDAGGLPVAQVLADLPDQLLVAGVPGPAPDPDGDAGAGDGHANDDLRQVRAVVLALPVGPEGLHAPVAVAVAVAVAVGLGDGLGVR